MTVAVALLGALPARSADGAGAREALALCRQADSAPAGEQRALLQRGLDAAEAAVQADERNAAAHFAIFCDLGKIMRLDGARPSSFFSLRRLRSEVDRTLELAPNDADALVGKAATLYYTPRLLGGDAVEGERLLRAALDVAPDYVDARLALARLLRARGARAEALVSAHQALDDARRRANGAWESEARRILAALGER
jgi:hypothetical protein